MSDATKILWFPKGNENYATPNADLFAQTNPRAMGGCLDSISCEHFTMIKALN